MRTYRFFVYQSADIIVVISLFVLVWLCFANTVNNDFVYDDFAYVKNNPSIRNIRKIGDYFTDLHTYQSAGPEGQFKVYRPLVTASFAIDYILWSDNPVGYHLTNTILHFLVSVLLYIFLILLFSNRGVAFVASAVFLVHPLQVEAVSWISGRGNLLYAMCALLCMICSVRFLRTNRISYYIMMLFLFALALFSKEMAMNIIPLELLIFLYIRKWDFKKITSFFIPMLIIAGAYMFIRRFVVGQTAQISYWGGSLFVTVVTMAKVVLKYLWILIYPLHLNVIPEIHIIHSVFAPEFFISFLVLVGLLFISVKYFRKSPFFFGVWWVMLSLTPVSNIIALRALFAERFLYFGVAGFAFSAVWGLQRLELRKFLLISTALIIVLLCRSVIRNTDWRNNFALWESVLRVDPANAKAHNGVGVELLRVGNTNGALAEFVTALAIDPDNVYFANNLALAYKMNGQPEQAFAVLEKSLSYPSDNAAVYHNLGLYYLEEQNYKKALGYLLEAVGIDSHYSNAYNSLGIVYSHLGDEENAVRSWRKAHNLMPDWIEPYYNIIVYYRKSGNLRKAEKFLREALELYPDEKVFLKLNND